jgi:DNA-binding PadR family transcriptional regulator
MPFGGQQRRRKGAARDAILSLLAEKPLNGYGLIKEISERTADTWHPSPGSIYPTLQQLVDEGLIEATSDDKRTDFQLTAEGQAYAEEHAEQYAQLWKTAVEHSEVNGDIRLSIGKLIGVAQQYRFAATAEQRDQAVKLIDETRRALYRILGE